MAVQLTVMLLALFPSWTTEHNHQGSLGSKLRLSSLYMKEIYHFSNPTSSEYCFRKSISADGELIRQEEVKCPSSLLGFSWCCLYATLKCTYSLLCSTLVLNFKAKIERKDRSKSPPVTCPEEKISKRPRQIKDHNPHVSNKFLTVWGVSFKHTGLMGVAMGPDMYGCQSPFFGHLWNKSWDVIPWSTWKEFSWKYPLFLILS